MAQAGRLSLRSNLADGVRTTRAGETGADGCPQTLAVWISLKALSAEALLLVSSDVAVGVRTTRARLTKRTHRLSAAPVRVTNGVGRAVAVRFTSRVTLGTETARIGIAWVLALDAATNGVGQLDVAGDAGATSESVVDCALGVGSARRRIARVLWRSARHDRWFTLILGQAETSWVSIDLAATRVGPARIWLAQVSLRN